MKRYSVRPDIPKKAHAELAAHPEIVRSLLFHRGITTAEAAEKFLHPVFEDNHDPFSLAGMDAAVKRIFDAVQNSEKIIIYSDYDADGIPGAVILHDFFRKIGYGNFENYIPHRVLEGFGLNVEAIDAFAAGGAKLIITVDCGTANLAEAEKIKDHGIDLIVIDHHEPVIENGKEILPHALAVLNHKKENCGYPESVLSASGVSFKLVQAFLKTHGKEFGVAAGWEKWLLDMVAVAAVADMVPLAGENRILARYGLTVLRKSPRPGLQRLLSVIRVDQKHITEDDIGFMIAPRINAASRMGDPEDAFFMLVEKDAAKAAAYAEHLNKVNDERKVLVATMVKEMKKAWQKVDPEKKRRVLTLGNPDWRPSLLGIAASSLADDHAGPIFLWGRGEGKNLKGSCRANGAADVVALMRECADCFEESGGHAASGGFSVKFDAVADLADRLEAAHEKLGANVEEKETLADAKLSIDEVTRELAGMIADLAPFGMANPKPLFVFENVTPVAVSIFGKKKDHLRLDFAQSNGRKISAIAFFKKPEDFSAKLGPGEKVTLLANVEKSHFLGREEIRLRIVDIC
ncbi:MAG: single-stranded-DNA-specific exonuclease RecJ [Patescibacteria group bacterium]|nr:single-stranded-DNA-specific exonuclease RecJ [Patescibacteria group bacterium]MDE1945702.1 single-stranded-DNA-specific exonuclease RecJ [Patescibacteria group bacterium]